MSSFRKEPGECCKQRLMPKSRRSSLSIEDRRDERGQTTGGQERKLCRARDSHRRRLDRGQAGTSSRQHPDRRKASHVHSERPSGLPPKDRRHRGTDSLAVSQRHFDGRLRRGTASACRRASQGPQCQRRRSSQRTVGRGIRRVVQARSVRTSTTFTSGPMAFTSRFDWKTMPTKSSVFWC